MSVKERTTFLRLRGLKVSGRKQELVNRTLVGKQGLHIQLMTAEEVEAEIKNEYGNKIVIDRITIFGNPFDIKKDWLEENGGINGLYFCTLTTSAICVFIQVSFHLKNAKLLPLYLLLQLVN